MSKKARKLRATAKNEAETARSEMDKLFERLKREGGDSFDRRIQTSSRGPKRKKSYV